LVESTLEVLLGPISLIAAQHLVRTALLHRHGQFVLPTARSCARSSWTWADVEVRVEPVQSASVPSRQIPLAAATLVNAHN
jgi:hypothetical protein